MLYFNILLFPHTFILPIVNIEIFTIDYTVQNNKLNKIIKQLDNTGNNKIKSWG